MKKNIFATVLAAGLLLVASVSYASYDRTSATEKGYVEYSVIDGRKSMTAYDKNDNWLYTIQYYKISNLAKGIVDRVRSVYPRYGVTGIQKVQQPGLDVVHVVNIENEESIKIVRLTKNDVELIKDYIKG